MINSYVYTPARECGRLSYWIRQQNDGAENVLADGGKCPELLPREEVLVGLVGITKYAKTVLFVSNSRIHTCNEKSARYFVHSRRDVCLFLCIYKYHYYYVQSISL